MLFTPPPVTNCHTFSDPLPLERDVLYGRRPGLRKGDAKSEHVLRKIHHYTFRHFERKIFLIPQQICSKILMTFLLIYPPKMSLPAIITPYIGREGCVYFPILFSLNFIAIVYSIIYFNHLDQKSL